MQIQQKRMHIFFLINSHSMIPIIQIYRRQHQSETQLIQYIHYIITIVFVIFFTSYKENFYLKTKNIYICIKE